MATTVITWSHKLHQDSINTLKDIYGHLEIVNINYHSEDRNKLEAEIEHILDGLQKEGVLQGRVVISPPSLSVATSLVIIGIFRCTGVFPDVINLLQCADGRYRPSAHVPIFKGQEFGDRRRRARAI